MISALLEFQNVSIAFTDLDNDLLRRVKHA